MSFFQEGPVALVLVIGTGDVGAIPIEAVAAHGVVEHRIDAVFFVDVRDPALGHADVEPDDVDAHLLEEGHLFGQGRLDERVGLAPEVVEVIFADRQVGPVHAEDHQVLAVDLQLEAPLVSVNLNQVGRSRIPGHPGGRRGRRFEGAFGDGGGADARGHGRGLGLGLGPKQQQPSKATRGGPCRLHPASPFLAAPIAALNPWALSLGIRRWL